MRTASPVLESELWRQIARFVVVGGGVALVYLCTTALLAGPAGLPFQAALAIGYAAGLATHFTTHRLWTFAHRERRYARDLPTQLSSYLAVALAQYALTAASVALLPGVIGASELVVWLFTAALLTVLTFVWLKMHLFQHAEPG